MKKTFTLKSRVPVVLKKHEAAVEDAMVSIGVHWQGAARIACPVDTGRLRSSIAWATHTQQPSVTLTGPEGGSFTPPKPPPRTVLVGTNVEYAPYVHEGYPAQVVTVPQHNVREHTRRITSAFGRVIQAQTVTVRAHSRGPYQMQLRERPATKFIEGPLRQYLGDYANLIHRKLEEAYQ